MKLLMFKRNPLMLQLSNIVIKIDEVIEDQRNYLQQNLRMLREKMKIDIIE
jgi:hypothetical protein